jgi:hypothetical protein
MRWSWVPAVVVVVACTLPGGAPKTAADVITPGQASQVVASYWTENEKANVAGDPALFAPIEAGPALTFDQAAAARAARLNRHLAQARPLRKVTVYVPHQPRYPAEFAARIDTVGTDRNGKPNDQPFSFFNVFEKSASRQAWKSTLFVPSPLGETITIAIGGDGYAEQVPITGRGQTVAPAEMGQLVADYINAATAGLGVDDSQLDGGPGIDPVARGQRLTIEGARQAGFTVTFHAASGPGGSHAYRSTQGRAVVFFAVSNQEVVAAAREGACIVQDSRLHLPPDIPPGNYGRVESKVLALLVASDPAATKGKATVLGMTSVEYDFKVEPTSGPCVETGPPTSV